jgi:S1-C subfamily serine protease
MFYEENDDYRPYQFPAQYSPSVTESRLRQSVRQAALQEDAWQPPIYPPSQPAAAPPPPSPRKPKKKGSGARTAAIFGMVLALLLVLGTGLFAGWEFANYSKSSVSATQAQASASSSTSTSTTSANTIEAQQEAAIAKVEPAVVELSVTTNQGQQIGSGVIIDKNGDIVTNNHVVSGAQTIVATLENGNAEKAQLIGSDAANDLAVVRIQPTPYMAVATIGDSSKLTVGQEVLAIGNPLGITETVTSGIVSALNRSVAESNSVTIKNAIQTDAPINPGNSGGALINLQGQLVGIPTLAAIDSETSTPANGVGFAIPSNQVKTIVAQIVQQAG